MCVFTLFTEVQINVLAPCSGRDIIYAVIFMDYLTKWLEVFATRHQTSLTIAELLVEKVTSRQAY